MTIDDTIAVINKLIFVLSDKTLNFLKTNIENKSMVKYPFKISFSISRLCCITKGVKKGI
jgi:hypothetical protein